MSKENFYAFMDAENPKKTETGNDKPFPESKEELAQAVAQDEALVAPWTHRVTIYCDKPSKEFFEELKGRNGVVAVFVKEKDGKSEMPESTPPDNK